MFLKRFTAPIDELEVIYRKRREERFSNSVPIKGYRIRKLFQPFIHTFLSFDQKMNNEKLFIVSDKRIKSNKPKIFVSTHIGGDDMQRCLQVIKEQSYMVLGDPRDGYKDIGLLLLFINGCIMFDTEHKNDRKIAFHRATEVLKNGQNLLIYPEGTWNITPSTLVLHLFLGAVRMAKATGAEIVPMAVEQYGDTFEFNVGENIDVNALGITEEIEINNYLRDILATLKYEIFERHSGKREEFSVDYLEQFQKNKIESFGHDYTMADIEKSYYIPKGVTEYDEAFAHLKYLKPNMQNAFLFDKRIKG